MASRMYTLQYTPYCTHCTDSCCERHGILFQRASSIILFRDIARTSSTRWCFCTVSTLWSVHLGVDTSSARDNHHASSCGIGKCHTMHSHNLLRWSQHKAHKTLHTVAANCTHVTVDTARCIHFDTAIHVKPVVLLRLLPACMLCKRLCGCDCLVMTVTQLAKVL